jgi:hypothetical protein
MITFATGRVSDFGFNVSNFRPCVVILQPSRERGGIRYMLLLDGVSSLDFGPASCGAFFMLLRYLCVLTVKPVQGEAAASISKNDHNPVKQRTMRFDTIQSVVKASCQRSSWIPQFVEIRGS